MLNSIEEIEDLENQLSKSLNDLKSASDDIIALKEENKSLNREVEKLKDDLGNVNSDSKN